jgi:hypothetical protein
MPWAFDLKVLNRQEPQPQERVAPNGAQPHSERTALHLRDEGPRVAPTQSPIGSERKFSQLRDEEPRVAMNDRTIGPATAPPPAPQEMRPEERLAEAPRGHQYTSAIAPRGPPAGPTHHGLAAARYQDEKSALVASIRAIHEQHAGTPFGLRELALELRDRGFNLDPGRTGDEWLRDFIHRNPETIRGIMRPAHRMGHGSSVGPEYHQAPMSRYHTEHRMHEDTYDPQSSSDRGMRAMHSAQAQDADDEHYLLRALHSIFVESGGAKPQLASVLGAQLRNHGVITGWRRPGWLIKFLKKFPHFFEILYAQDDARQVTVRERLHHASRDRSALEIALLEMREARIHDGGPSRGHPGPIPSHYERQFIPSDRVHRIEGLHFQVQRDRHE